LAKVSSVEDGPSENANQEQKEALECADPGDVGGALGLEKVGFIVFLVDAKGVDDAPATQS